MIYFTAHIFKCVCHCRRAMFRVLGMYNFVFSLNAVISTNEITEFITGHVTYNLDYTYKFQLKTTQD